MPNIPSLSLAKIAKNNYADKTVPQQSTGHAFDFGYNKVSQKSMAEILSNPVHGQ
ncbi:MAG: hypothetical protein M0Q95_09915 [Porticoccaceae bacterium]|jgi:hypothetical protein|nr:hypothetical protein [Porticoccaceae bacterium]